MDIVRYYVDREFKNADVIDELFRNCQVLLERLRSSEIEKNLANCLLKASRLWDLSVEQAYYMLSYYEGKDLKELVKYVDGNYGELQENGEEWRKVLERVDEQVRAIIYIK